MTSETASTPAGRVIEERCIGCGTCAAACAYGAVALRETGRGVKASVDPALCRGDGLCGSLCATGAIAPGGSSNEELLRKIDAAWGRA